VTAEVCPDRVFSQLEDLKKVTEDIGSSVVGLVVRKGKVD